MVEKNSNRLLIVIKTASFVGKRWDNLAKQKKCSIFDKIV
jgi:hypothetical protein